MTGTKLCTTEWVWWWSLLSIFFAFFFKLNLIVDVSVLSNFFMWFSVSFISLQVLIDNIKEFAPIIYTPTVGLVCQNYSGLFRRPRGMYFSAKDKGEMMSMIYNWPAQEVLHKFQ